MFLDAEHMMYGNNYSTATQEAVVYPGSQVYGFLVNAAYCFLGSESDRTLASIAQLADQEYEDEPAPSAGVINQISSLIREATGLLAQPMPEGVVATFYGEINVTWRRDSTIVRLACFPNRPSILQVGNLSQPLAPYQSQQNPTAQDVAQRLNALSQVVR
ncbi:MAG: hypothetical protein WBE37_27325 [Bryobacteraceae bacterium]